MKILKRKIINILKRIRDRILGPMDIKLEQQEGRLMALADANFRTRAMLKRVNNQPIHIVFVCHMPSLWSMFDSIYKSAVNDQNFKVTVVALPYRHISLPQGQYKDDGIFEYLNEKKINVIHGYDKDNDAWLNPDTIKPDYVFYQTPYRIFPDEWSVERLSMSARVCYLSYGTCLFRGEVDEIVHPTDFLKYTKLFFMENNDTKIFFENKFKLCKFFNIENIFLTGHPKIDSIKNNNDINGSVWKCEKQKNIKRILWTPRWRTSEGTCHFFDYKDLFFDFCEKHKEVDFVFRPHPLSLQNFIKTGEFSANDVEKMESMYEKSPNMSLDRSGDYVDTFLTSDVLVSDISSMLLEYFVTGKPIIYTHRVDVFNEFGTKLSAGFYWVKNVKELNEVLEMLISGSDPLKEKREALIKSLIFMPVDGSGSLIKNIMLSNFSSSSSL